MMSVSGAMSRTRVSAPWNVKRQLPRDASSRELPKSGSPVSLPSSTPEMPLPPSAKTRPSMARSLTYPFMCPACRSRSVPLSPNAPVKYISVLRESLERLSLSSISMLWTKSSNEDASS